MITATSDGRAVSSGIALSERLSPDSPEKIKNSALTWLVDNTNIGAEDLTAISQYRLSQQQINFLTNPDIDGPLIAIIEGLTQRDSLDRFEDYTKSHQFTPQEKQEHILCAGEWLAKYRQMHFYNNGIPPERYVDAERELVKDTHQDMILQMKSLGFYLLAHHAAGRAVDYNGSNGILETIAASSSGLKPIADSFAKMRADIADKKVRKEKYSLRDYSLPFHEYVVASSAIDNMPHHVEWVLRHVRPLLDLTGNHLFSSGCTQAIQGHYIDSMKSAYRREHGLSSNSEISAPDLKRMELRANSCYTNLVNNGLSKKFRAMFNTFSFFEN